MASEEESEGRVTEEEVLACAFGAWYEQFRDVTFKSEIIPLEESFVSYLMADGIRMPGGGTQGKDDDSGSSWGSGGSEEDEEETWSFPELEAQIEASISRLKGKVLPKLNWSCPKDAQWIQGSLCCEKASEVIMLLKASDFISHDICHSFEHCQSCRARPEHFTLVLRRWHSLREAGEFRCFVKESRLVAISQRNTYAFFEHLARAEERQEQLDAILAFFTERISGNFSLRTFAFDVYVDMPPRRRVWLVDFSPWCASTDPCLYDWDELHLPRLAGVSFEVPDFRVVMAEGECRSKLESYHRLPVELAQLKAGEGLEELMSKADQVLKEKGAEAA